jgi:hypothetical protein
MVRDAYSAGGQQHPHEADSNAQDQNLDLRGNAANLTQELAQLLAASIAQGQPGKRAGAPTGAELASLAALVSASHNQRGVSPGFKDGLSSLSYTPPQQQNPPVNSPVQMAEHHDDEPMPIPSTWRQPTVTDDDRWYRQQMGAAVLGLAAGLLVVVPSVLWLSGWLGGPQTAKTASTRTTPIITADSTAFPSDVKTVKVQVRPVEKTEVKTEVASQYVAATVEPRMAAILEPAPAALPPAAEAPPVPIPAAVQRAEPPRPKVEDVLAQAERRIESGDIAGAREMLTASESLGPGPIVFALAETYDPNMLAAWGTRGVTADVTKARSLYFRARDLGIARAQVRLEQLK